jgi:hypothetical protein
MACKGLIAAIFAPLIVACAPFAASSAPTLAPEQDSLVQATCDHVMGLAQGGVYRDLCRESLSASLARKIESEGMAASYSDCRHQGLTEGSAAFSACMLDHQSQPHAPTTQTASLAYDVNAPENTKSYFHVSNTEHWRRQQYSCAQLGLTPGTGAFGECVVSLTAVLQANPD